MEHDVLTMLNARFDRLEKKLDGLVTKEECELKRENESTKFEISTKKIAAIGGVITTVVAAVTTATVTIINSLK